MHVHHAYADVPCDMYTAWYDCMTRDYMSCSCLHVTASMLRFPVSMDTRATLHPCVHILGDR